MTAEPQPQTFTVRPPGPSHDTFVRLNDAALAADARVAVLAQAYVEKYLGEELKSVTFGWDEACDGPRVISYRTIDEWDLDPAGSNPEAGIGYEDDAFDDIEAAIRLLDNPWSTGLVELTRTGNSAATFQIFSHPDGPEVSVDELNAAIIRANAIRAEVEVAAIAALRERAPLNVTKMLLRQCLLHTFCSFNSVSNGTGRHYDDDVMNELDPYAEAIRWKASDEALAAGLTRDEDGDFELTRTSPPAAG